ncbi:MAG: hypothetical protein ACLQIB_29450 [Isosphaeraceae bacterium]
MAGQRMLTGTAQTASNVMGAAFRLVRRAALSLGVWLLPLVVAALTAAALCGSLSFHRGSGPTPDRDSVVIDGEKPFSIIDLYYSRDYIEVVKKAQEEHRDILANVQALESAWNAASPAMPLTIELISSVLPEPFTGKSPAPGLRAKAAVNETNFQELRPLLDDVRNLILEGDGSGCGLLRCSGYQAQPVDKARNSSAGSRDKDAGSINLGPAKLAPGPVETF